MTRAKRGKRTSSATTLAVDVSNELWCSCQRPEDGRFMIHCDVQGEECRVWYHVWELLTVLPDDFFKCSCEK